MSTWSRPYITVTDADGSRVNWSLPSPMPWAAGACADQALRTPADLGLPTGGTIKVRWRTPDHANPRSIKRPTSDQQIIALAGDVQRAFLAEGAGWMPDANGGLHPTSVSTALTRLRQRQIVRRGRDAGRVVITLNPNLASRADKRARAVLRGASGMPQVAVTHLSRGSDRG